MTKLNLKSVLKKEDTVAVLQSFIAVLKSDVCITDDSGKILFGNAEFKEEKRIPVKLNDDIIGFIYGRENAVPIANLLNHLVQKEAEKKKLGAEVLNLYQEINLIFNFSERLAQTIDAQSISSITLEEARHVISSDSGAIVLWDEKQKKLQVLSAFGESFFEEETINRHLSLLLKIILNGQSEIIADTNPLIEAGIILPGTNSVLYSALKVNHRIMGAVLLASSDSIQYTAAHLKLLTTLALQSSAAIESALLYERNINEAKERENAMRLVYEATGKFVPYEFIGALGHKVITDVRLGDQVEKIVTVLFSDIRDYTTLSEQMTPEENFRFVCSFNERMGPAIRKHNGFINQYLGDAVMAIFPGQASDALNAAIEMHEEVQKLNEERLLRNAPPIKIGVGIHTGPLIMGITGDQNRMDAATISDTVNTASRLEGLTKQYRASILLSDACLLQIEKENYYLRYLGLVQLKGKQEPLHIYECFSPNTKEEVARKQKTLSLFNEGIENYLNSSFSNSVQAFESLTEINPGDLTAAFFLNNAKNFLQKGIPENWNGIIEMASK
jgi:class 3 adenylate cyclase